MDVSRVGIVRGFTNQMFIVVMMVVRKQAVQRFRRPEGREKQHQCQRAETPI